ARVLHIRQKENTVYKWFSRRAIKESSLARNIRKRCRNLLHNISMMKNKLEKLCFHLFEDHPDSAMLMIGLLAFGLMIVVSYLCNIVFDGIIQTHLVGSEGDRKST